MKKLIVFDLDGTLAPSKSPLPDEMGEQLSTLLTHKQVCVISGGKFEQFKLQLINNLHAIDKELVKLHIMPTCGTKYYKYDLAEKTWAIQYSEDIPEKNKTKIIKAIEASAKKLGYWEVKTWGDIIEDRGSQVTFSALGQGAPVDAKIKWDPTGDKKRKLRDHIAKLIPNFEVRAGGETSIDITRPGIDKAYGMRKLMSELKLEMKDILFIGDRLQPGGNDYPVKEMGIDSIEVSDWHDTKLVVEGFNLVCK
jgi:HAD superfamily hydrolase (TIGR01484 family)